MSSDALLPKAAFEFVVPTFSPSDPVIRDATTALGKRIVVIDFETTGFSSNAEILEIGAVEIEDGEVTGHCFHAIVRGNLPSDPRAESKHGISLQVRQGALSMLPHTAILQLQRFVEQKPSVIVAHNLSFDMTALSRHVLSCGLDWDVAKASSCCSKMLFNSLFPRQAASLADCKTFFGIECDVRLHSALGDAQLTACVWIRLMAIVADFIED